MPRRKPMLGETRERDHGYVGYVTLSPSIVFSMKYATEFADPEKGTLCNNTRPKDYPPAQATSTC